METDEVKKDDEAEIMRVTITKGKRPPSKIDDGSSSKKARKDSTVKDKTITTSTSAIDVKQKPKPKTLDTFFCVDKTAPDWKKHKSLLKKLHESMKTGKENATTVCKIVLNDLESDIKMLQMQSHDVESTKEDKYSTSLIPNDVGCRKALWTKGDGNCFFNSLSILKLGNENGASLLRIATSVELFLNGEAYKDHPSIINVLKPLGKSMNIIFPDVLAIEQGQTEWYKTHDQAAAIRKEAMNMSDDKAYVPLIAFLGAANVLKQNIHSVYPDVRYDHRIMFHQLIEPFNQTESDKPILKLLWTRCSRGKAKDFIPNHFVPIV